VLAEDYLDINGSPINPYSRVRLPSRARGISL
jgi:vacuolar-type H+-ATPase subunit B/Vma2